MLASHNPRTFVRTRRNDTSANQFLLPMGLALIEASEHVLATAKRLLHSAPNAELQMVRVPRLMGPVARRTEPVDVGERTRCPRTVVGTRQLGPPCEVVVENE